MAELYIGVKFEGTEVDIADLEAFFKGTKSLTFKEVVDLLIKATSVTITAITRVPVTLNTISEETIVTTPSG